MNPKVSVILPVYNAGQFIEAAIRSILDQTFRDFELIILNDGSTDNSEKQILALNDKRIRYVKNERNLGLIATLNKGLELANGEYIARMDQDDISLPTRFEKQVAFLDTNKEITVVATKLVIINEEGLDTDYWKEDYDTTTAAELSDTLPVINCIGHPTVMMRTEPVKRIGYNKKFKNSEDWGLWLTLLSNGLQIAKLNEVLLRYRVHQKSTTVTVNKTNVARKIMTFKRAYLASRIFGGRFTATDAKVLQSLSRDVLKYLFKPVLGPIIHILRLPWLQIIHQFFKARRQLLCLKQPVNLVYIFPFYHTGGAEKVHAAIMEAVNDKNAVSFITRTSEDNAFFEKFAAYATVIEVDALLKLRYSQHWLMKKIAALSPGQLTVFGCNSQFFYELLPALPPSARCIDLVHAFVHMNEWGPERWSLPVIPRLNARVVINEKTRLDFECFYRAHKVDLTYLSRIRYIPNFVEQKPFIGKNYTGNLKVLYAGRGATEKRLHLIAEAAYISKNKGLPIEFHFAGDVAAYLPAEYLHACILHGTVTNEAQMDTLYAGAHFLIMASSREGFPMVIMEAMMQGTVPLTTPVGGIPEHVHHFENGLLADATEEPAIIAQFVSFLEHYLLHREELERMGKNAHHYALQHFSKANFFNAYLQLLKP